MVAEVSFGYLSFLSIKSKSSLLSPCLGNVCVTDQSPISEEDCLKTVFSFIIAVVLKVWGGPLWWGTET